jgi:predicted amidohydrolase YtcJ
MDLRGMHVIPGLIDAHRHFFVSAMASLFGSAEGWKSKHDALAAINDACRAGGTEKRWVFFKGMDHTKWKDPTLPGLKEIDDAAMGVPVFAVDISFHRALVSSEAVRRARLRRDLLRCPGDVILNRDGTLKGLIWEEAVGLVFSSMFREILSSYSRDEKRRLITEEAEKLLACGLTHVHDPGVPWDVQDMLRDARASTRLRISWSVSAYESFLAPPGAEDEEKAVHPDMVPKSVKFFLDGAHRTASSMPIIAGLKSMLRAGKESISTRSSRPFRLLFEQQITLSRGKLALPYKRFKETGDLIRRASYYADRGYRLVLHALGNDAAVQAAEVVKCLRPGGGASIEHLVVMETRRWISLPGAALLPPSSRDSYRTIRIPSNRTVSCRT